jgi:hypothetical protein
LAPDYRDFSFIDPNEVSLSREHADNIFGWNKDQYSNVSFRNTKDAWKNNLSKAIASPHRPEDNFTRALL